MADSQTAGATTFAEAPPASRFPFSKLPSTSLDSHTPYITFSPHRPSCDPHDAMPRHRWVEPPLRLHRPAPVRATKSFLDLPAELRNTIYELVVLSGHKIEINSQQPPVTRVCRQLRRECLPIYVQRNKFEALLSDNTTTKKLSKWISQLGSDGPHIQELQICFFGNDLDDPQDILREWNDLIFALKLASLRPDALRWRLYDWGSPSAFESRMLKFQVFFDNIISPLLQQYELAHGIFRPGIILHEQKKLYRHDLLSDHPGLTTDTQEERTWAHAYEYLDIMYDEAPDAYSWVGDFRHSVLRGYPTLRAQAFSLEKQAAWAASRQRSGMRVEPSSIANVRKHLAKARATLAELETRYQNWVNVEIDIERLTQSMSGCRVSRDGVDRYDQDGTSREDYIDLRLAALAEVERDEAGL